MNKLLFKLLLLFFVFNLFARADFVLAQESVEVNLFYSNTCPHCHAEREFLKTFKEKYPKVIINEYEVMTSSANQQLLGTFYENYNVPVSEQGYVPVTFTPDKYFIGFNKQIGKDIESCLEDCMGNTDTSTSLKVNVPFIGEVNVSEMSLFLLTVTLGSLDGFNPCAMWVLIFLITLLLNVQSRKRMYLIGGTFILASGVVYFLILAGWLKMFEVMAHIELTRTLIGVFAIVLGAWQINNFIHYKPGTCTVVDGKGGFQEKIRNALKDRAEKLVLSPLNLGIIGGIIFLALGVNLVEFFCSAGLPAIYTKVLSLNEMPKLSYYLYLLLYTFFFMLDDLIVFLLAVFTISKIGFTEKYNYWATLLGGLLILILGLLLLFKPELLMFA